MKSFEKKVTTVQELIDVLSIVPSDTEVVTDVGSSMFSGYGTIQSVRYVKKYNILELIFA